MRKPFSEGEKPKGLVPRPLVDYGAPNPKVLIYSPNISWVFSIDRLRMFRVKNESLWHQTISMTLEELPHETAHLANDSPAKQALDLIKQAERGDWNVRPLCKQKLV